MAKLLKFGIGYTPNKPIVDKKTGQKTTENIVDLLLFIDGKSGFSVFPQLQNFLGGRVKISKNGETITIMVPEDKFEIFANPNGKLMGRILSVIEQAAGYVADSKDIAALPNRLQTVKSEILNYDKSTLDSDMNDYIEDLISGIEKDFNDPRFQQILNAMHIFNGVGGFSNLSQNSTSFNDNDVAIKETKLSVENVLRILSQWRKAGRANMPTYLATENQWSRFFGGTVRQNALKLYIQRPDKVAGVSTNTVTRQLGIDPNAANAGGAVGRAVHSIARGGGMDKWRGAQTAYAPVVYYDIVDVDGVDPNSLTGNSANYYDPNTVTTSADTDSANDIVQQNDTANDIVNNTQPMTEASLGKKLLKYATDNNIDGIKLAIQRDGTIGGLMFMISHIKSIFRNRDAEEKKATTEQILFVILKHYNIYDDVVKQLYKKLIPELRTSQGKANKKLLIGIFSFAYDVIKELDSINESIGKELTLVDVIGYFGFTVDEYKNLPENEKEADYMLHGVRESFIKTFNKLLKQ